tara:strand:+ start:190 stop:1338 length:1149 start_codon:yes stop_codon:yes gene_type:complete
MNLLEIDACVNDVCDHVKTLSINDAVELLNHVRERLHAVSPFSGEPVDFVRWVKTDDVTANDYNPNSVAPPEMELLKVSIEQDGYTQPIVSWETGDDFEVVDGFHRHRVGSECKTVNKRIHGYLPLAVIRDDREGRGERIASTIRHNRARGKHSVTAMSDIVIELKRRNWADTRISRELGMDQDEILRLCQITGLEELFSDTDFSKSWDVEGEVTESDFEDLTDDVSAYGDEVRATRTVNTSDENRKFHTYDKWECHKAGFYDTHVDGKTKDECNETFREFMCDTDAFDAAVQHITSQWKHSCEHYLTNAAMNRIAWLGQAACCHAKGIPAVFRGGWSLLTTEQQDTANDIALMWLNNWLENNGMETVDAGSAAPDRQSEIY